MGGTKTISSVAERLAGIQLQDACYGKVVALGWGTFRAQSHLIWYNDFKAVAHTDTQKVGKGGGTEMQNTTWTYYASIMLLIAGVPFTTNAGSFKVWKNKDITDASALGFTIFDGERPQTVWSYLTTAHPDQAIPYSGNSLAVVSDYLLDSNAGLTNHSFEVEHLENSTYEDARVTPVKYDALPSEAIVDMLTNSFYGGLWSINKIHDFGTVPIGGSSFDNYCIANEFLLSPYLDEQKPLGEHLRSILDACNSDVRWHSTVNIDAMNTYMDLEFIPLCDIPFTGSSGTPYTPTSAASSSPLDIQFHVTEEDLLGLMDENNNVLGDGFVQVDRKNPQDVYNVVPVEYLDRVNDYNITQIQEESQADVIKSGKRVAAPMVLHSITRYQNASRIAKLNANRNASVKTTYTVKLTWRYLMLEPLDIVSFTYAPLGLSNEICRVKSITLPASDAEADGLTVELDEWPRATGYCGVSVAAAPSNGLVASPHNAPPGDCTAPLIFEMSGIYAGGAAPQLVIATGGGTEWGGANVYASMDDTTYNYIGSIDGPCMYGALNSNLNAAPSPPHDLTNTLSVLLASGGPIESVSSSVAASLRSLFWVNGELISFANSALAGTNHYHLTDLYRGSFGTGNQSHLSGVPVCQLNSNLLRYTMPAQYVGQTIYLKLCSFNRMGSQIQDLADVTAYTYVTTGVASDYPAPSSVAFSISATPDYPVGSTGGINGTSSVGQQYLNITWSLAAGVPDPDYFEIIALTGSDPTDRDTWLFSPPTQTDDGTRRAWSCPIAAAADITGVQVAVRSAYAY